MDEQLTPLVPTGKRTRARTRKLLAYHICGEIGRILEHRPLQSACTFFGVSAPKLLLHAMRFVGNVWKGADAQQRKHQLVLNKSVPQK